QSSLAPVVKQADRLNLVSSKRTFHFGTTASQCRGGNRSLRPRTMRAARLYSDVGRAGSLTSSSLGSGRTRSPLRPASLAETNYDGFLTAFLDVNRRARSTHRGS